jgi:hypothetical protein
MDKEGMVGMEGKSPLQQKRDADYVHERASA